MPRSLLQLLWEGTLWLCKCLLKETLFIFTISHCLDLGLLESLSSSLFVFLSLLGLLGLDFIVPGLLSLRALPFCCIRPRFTECKNACTVCSLLDLGEEEKAEVCSEKEWVHWSLWVYEILWEQGKYRHGYSENFSVLRKTTFHPVWKLKAMLLSPLSLCKCRRSRLLGLMGITFLQSGGCKAASPKCCHLAKQVV